MLSLYHKDKSLGLIQSFREVTFPAIRLWEQNLMCVCETYWLNDIIFHQENISSTLKSINFKSFSNIKVSLRMLGIYLWLHLFSFMCRLKTYTRSTMVSERLSGIALILVHQEIVPDIEKVADLLALTNRRVNFI